MSESSGTTQGRSFYLLVGLVVTWFVLASVVPALPSTKDDKPAVTLNHHGATDLILDPVMFEGELWLELRLVIGSTAPAPDNAPGYHAVSLAHDFFRVALSEAPELEAGIRAWSEKPHNDTVFRIPGDVIGLSLTGTDGVTWDPSFQPAVIVNIQVWLNSGRGHLHGGNYTTFNPTEGLAIADAIATWLANPQEGEPIYSRSVY